MSAGKIILAIVGVLFAALAAGVVAAWEPDRPVSELARRWAPPPSVFVEVDGMKVHLRDEGWREDPRPIVLLHGTSASLHTWDGWVHALEAERRVIRFDLPGFGLTGPPPDADYRIGRYVRFMTAILDQLEVEHCVLGGSSFGGHVAWETALALPSRIDGLILVGAAGYPRESISVPIGFRLAKMPALSGLAERILPRHVIESSLTDIYGDPSKVTPELIDRYFELTLREGNRRAVRERFAQSPPDARSALVATLKLPTLILWGGRDRLIPPDHAERFARDIAGSRSVVFEELGHVPHEEDPDRSVEAVKQFLGSLPTPGRRQLSPVE